MKAIVVSTKSPEEQSRAEILADAATVALMKARDFLNLNIDRETNPKMFFKQLDVGAMVINAQLKVEISKLPQNAPAANHGNSPNELTIVVPAAELADYQTAITQAKGDTD